MAANKKSLRERGLKIKKQKTKRESNFLDLILKK
jgi:hypothetical protein